MKNKWKLIGMDLDIYHEICNKNRHKHVPHEWIFIKNLLHGELKKDLKIAEKFVIYVLQFYPDYKWIHLDLNDMVSTVVVECAYHDLKFLKVHEDVESLNTISDSITFGDIVTDFLIRYRGYSLIGCSGENIIVTSHSNCDKRFIELLEKGFSLYRLARVGFKEISSDLQSCFPFIEGYFYTLPVLPTKETYVCFDEVIEHEGKPYVILKKD